MVQNVLEMKFANINVGLLYYCVCFTQNRDMSARNNTFLMLLTVLWWKVRSTLTRDVISLTNSLIKFQGRDIVALLLSMILSSH